MPEQLAMLSMTTQIVNCSLFRHSITPFSEGVQKIAHQTYNDLKLHFGPQGKKPTAKKIVATSRTFLNGLCRWARLCQKGGKDYFHEAKTMQGWISKEGLAVFEGQYNVGQDVEFDNALFDDSLETTNEHAGVAGVAGVSGRSIPFQL
jgi:hypothetical protein